MILLPSKPLPEAATPRPLDAGGWQQPIGAGATTRLDRLGTRMAMDVTLPRLKPGTDGRLWVARLCQAIGDDAQMAFPQPLLDVGAPGSPTVAGGGQAGGSITITGLAAGYSVREGQAFNLFDAGGRPYLHFARADVTAGGGGGATIPLWPMMRMSPAGGSQVALAAPVIRGWLSGNERGWTLARAGTRGLQFTITERK